GHKPYPWQLDCAEALVLGIYCIVLAGTGFRKTLPFTIPFLASQQDYYSNTVEKVIMHNVIVHKFNNA
ncbi:hypothetical protein PAXRUDRAFT_165990, partial [Paxillus rubicundulus Ve08.2h10]